MSNLNHTSVSPQQLNDLIKQGQSDYQKGNSGLLLSIMATFPDNDMVQQMVMQAFSDVDDAAHAAKIDRIINDTISYGID